MILLDSDVLIDAIRQFSPATAWLRSVSSDTLAVPGYVMMELIAGCRDSREQQRTEAITSTLDVVWPSPASCEKALADFRAMHLAHGLGILDALIAHTAIELDLPLHTFNVKHFQHVPGLRTIQPYQRQQP